MKTNHRSGFSDVAVSRLPALRRFAFALCGDWHQADDLVQEALVKLYVAWPLRHEGAVDAWLRTTLARQWVDHTRKPWWRHERSSHVVPEGISREPDPGETVGASQLLQQVTPRQRACLVLRFLEDHSVESTAAMLGISPGTVKSLTSRGLETLRQSDAYRNDAIHHGKAEQ